MVASYEILEKTLQMKRLAASEVRTPSVGSLHIACLVGEPVLELARTNDTSFATRTTL